MFLGIHNIFYVIINVASIQIAYNRDVGELPVTSNVWSPLSSQITLQELMCIYVEGEKYQKYQDTEKKKSLQSYASYIT